MSEPERPGSTGAAIGDRAVAAEPPGVPARTATTPLAAHLPATSATPDAIAPDAASTATDATPPRESRRHRGSGAITLIAMIMLSAALYFGRGLFVPITLAILLALVLTPALRALAVLWIPRPVAAVLIVAGLTVAVGGVFLSLAPPAAAWLGRVPTAVEALEHRVREWRKPLDSANEVTTKLMSLGSTSSDGRRSRVEVIAAAPSPIVGVLSEAPGMLASVVATVFLTLLLLIYGDMLLRKLVSILPALRVKKDLVAGTREAQHELSRYLFTVAVINATLGAITAAALWALGFPEPLFWGTIVALLNFAPYVGPLVGAMLLLLMGVTEQQGMMAFAPISVFLFLHLIEGQLVTPLLVGRQLALDPVVLFVGLIVFGWLWGIAGLLMAVPILVCLKIIARRVDGGETIATLLSARVAMPTTTQERGPE